ncbi:MAG: amidohydrolase family protein [Lentisphaeria bacterium]|nr:amidohydrolase family protein [Lentisphaeria bacterium]
MKEVPMTRLDIHVHCDINDPEALQRLADQCRREGTIACLSGGLRYGGHDFLPNEEVIDICKRFSDCMVPLAKLDLWETADPAEVYHYAEKGVKGFKCIYPYYEYDHDIYMPVYEAAAKCGLPLLFHTGNYRPSPSDEIYRRPMLRNMNPITLDRIARSFQSLKIVMAHMGTRIFQDEASQYLKIHANLYADLGGSGQWFRMQAHDLAEMFKSDVAEVDVSMKNYRKLVLGTDAYVHAPEIMTMGAVYYMRLLRRIGVPNAIISEIMGRTVASWMNIELDNPEQ